MSEHGDEQPALKAAIEEVREAEQALQAAHRAEERAEDQLEHALENLERLEHEPREAEIVVNGRKRTAPGDVVSFEEVVKIAFPNGPSRPDVIYTVTFSNADQIPAKGELDKGGTVKVKTKGRGETSFNVTETVKS